MILIASREEKELIKRLRAIGGDDDNKVSTLSADVLKLREKIVTLEIEKSKKEEEFDKRERELRHMIGLEKKRQEFEVEQAKRETTVKVREENLAADKLRFEENLKFNTERFEKMEKYLKDMLSDILKRLPDVNLTIKQGGKR